MADDPGLGGADAEVMLVPGAPRHAAFSPDGALLALAAGDSVHLVEVGTWITRRVLCARGARVVEVAFSPDGALIAASTGADVRAWDAVTGRRLAALAGHRGMVTSVAFMPGGTRAVTGSADGTARIWDATTGTAIATLAGLPGGGHATFLPDGSYQAAGPGDSLWWTTGLRRCPPGELDLRHAGKRPT